MLKKTSILMCAVALALGLSACSTNNDPMTPYEATVRSFPNPDPGKAGVYIYRDSNLGMIYDMGVFVNGTCVGENSAHSFLYMQLPGNLDYIFSAESEFSPNSIKLHLDAGKNYFINHYLKFGVLSPGANVEHITDLNAAKTGVLNGRLVTNNKCYGLTFDYLGEYPEMKYAPKVNFVLNPVKTTVVMPDGTESTPPKFLANWQTAAEIGANNTAINSNAANTTNAINAANASNNNNVASSATSAGTATNINEPNSASQAK